MNKAGKITLFYFILTLFSIKSYMLIAQDTSVRRIEDDSYLRASLVNSWFRENPVDVLARRPELHHLRGGSQVQLRIETSSRNREEFAIVLARGQNGNFSSWNQGSWSLIRNRSNDPRNLRIRYFPRSDFNTYIQFRPFSEERSFLDLVIYDAFVIRSLPLPLSFERLYVMPIEEILGMAGDNFPLHYFDPYPGAYREIMTLVSAIRGRLASLLFIDDGAIDENGDFVFINTLLPQNIQAQGGGGVNCSGFVKWVVDGILRPFTEQRLPIAPIKLPFGSRGSSYTDIWEELRDPFFGLDWNRNLASRAGTVLRSPAFASLEEIEVRHMPFPQILIRQPDGSGSLMYPAFVENAGYASEALIPLLYTLAIDEPGRIYLAAVNNELGLPTTHLNPRGIPRMRQYYHVAVLIPFFNERGTFQVAVFESAEETSITNFVSRYRGESINLVRIPIEGSFDP